jgi:outer membrane lipoprotein-sorting protein
MISTVLGFGTMVVGQATPSINQYVQEGFKDAAFTALVKTGNQKELLKINDDFGQSYRFKSTKVRLKEPYMLRLETTVEDTDILYILNGPIRRVRIPKAKINVRQDLAKRPGMRQTFLDFGILTPSMFRGDLFTAKFVRNDRATSNVVFDIGFIPKLDDTSRHRIWIDPEKKIITKREWYSQSGRQLATFFYNDPEKYSGIWFPSRCVVRNNDNVVAGETWYDQLKANGGLPDSLFAVR